MNTPFLQVMRNIKFEDTVEVTQDKCLLIGKVIKITRLLQEVILSTYRLFHWFPNEP